MHKKETPATLTTLVGNLEEKKVLALVRKHLEKGDDPWTIVEECQAGLRIVGERYENKEYFIAGLIMAGEIFREMMELVQPIISHSFTSNEAGHILLGTAQGDIHDIGKNNLSMLLQCHGFTVSDMGVDVPPTEFLVQATALKPDVIGLSGLLTLSYDSMQQTVQLLRNSADKTISAIPIIIGGSHLNDQVCQYVGADYWATDAMHGVRLCQRLMANHPS